MPRYIVTWEIEIGNVDSPEEAVKEAIRSMKDGNLAFNVEEVKPVIDSSIPRSIIIIADPSFLSDNED